MKTATLILLAAIAISFSGCKKNCDDFHEGAKCENEIREKYYGIYRGALVSGAGSVIQNFSIVESSQGPEYLFSNPLTFKLFNSSSFKIQNQTVIIGGASTVVEGEGSINNHQLIFNYTFNPGTAWAVSYSFSGTQI